MRNLLIRRRIMRSVANLNVLNPGLTMRYGRVCNLWSSLFLSFFIFYYDNSKALDSNAFIKTEMCGKSERWWNWYQTLYGAVLRLLVMCRQMCKHAKIDLTTEKYFRNKILTNMYHKFYGLQVAPKLFKELKWR